MKFEEVYGRTHAGALSQAEAAEILGVSERTFRRRRPRRALPGMMLHQDGSRHEWMPGRWWDVIVTMDNAISEIYSAYFVAEKGTMSSFRALGERGLFRSLYADRGSHYWHTPEAGGTADKDNPTQGGRALQQLGIKLIPVCSPEARGRSERMFSTLQKRLPQELRHRRQGRGPLPQGGLPAPAQRPLRGHAGERRLGLRPLRRRAR